VEGTINDRYQGFAKKRKDLVKKNLVSFLIEKCSGLQRGRKEKLGEVGKACSVSMIRELSKKKEKNNNGGEIEVMFRNRSRSLSLQRLTSVYNEKKTLAEGTQKGRISPFLWSESERGSRGRGWRHTLDREKEQTGGGTSFNYAKKKTVHQRIAWVRDSFDIYAKVKFERNKGQR